MLKAANEGKTDIVKSKMKDYIISENQENILNKSINNNK